MPAGSLWPVFACLLGLWPIGAAFGQERTDDPRPAQEVPGEPSPAPAANATAESPRAIGAGPLDTIFLRDSKGNLVPVLGMPFEEFERLLRLQRGLVPPPPPGFVIRRLTMDGTVEGDIATFKFSTEIQIREEGWVSVPIRLQGGVIGPTVTHDGPGEHFLAPDAAGGDYVCWLKGKSTQPHTVGFEVSFRVESAEEKRRLSATLPLATESLLRIRLPQQFAEAALQGGEGVFTTESLANGHSQLSVLGASGDLVLAWREGGMMPTDVQRLEATGNVTVRIESEHRITSEARLRVRSLGQPLESFSVQLPPGMELAPVAPATDYTVRDADEDSEPNRLDRPQQVRVNLMKPTTSAAEIVLRAQRQPTSEGNAVFTPADFNVVGAVRHRGTMDFIAEGDWQLDWSNEASVHRLEIPVESSSQPVAARFEYFRQPSNLALRVTARPSRLSVEPTHMVYVDAQQVRAETLLKCRIRGARAAGLRLALGDWKYDRLTPDTLFDLPEMREDGEVFVPFRSGVQLPAELELKLEAHQAGIQTAGQIGFDLPRCMANNVAPAAVLVFAADNIELTPQPEQMVGLSPDPTSLRMPGRQQAPLVYRDLGGGESARFIARIRRLSRVTTVNGRARVRIDGQQLQVEQRLDYRVAHEPQRVFPLTAPTEVVAVGNLQVLLGDEPLPVSPSLHDEVSGNLSRLTFSTPADQIGFFQVLVRYALPLRWNRREALPLRLPLVTPVLGAEDQFSGQHVEFSLAEGIQIELDAEELEEINRAVPAAANGLAYQWPHLVTTSDWILESVQNTEGTGIAIPQMWAQTWFSPRIRQERVAFRVRAERETILIRIDKSVKQSSMQTAVDGREVPHSFRQPGILMVTLPAAVRDRECVLELSYTVDPPPPWLGIMRETWKPAQIEEAQPPRRVFWQLVLPGDQHLLMGPPDLASEMTMSSDRWFARPRAVFDQRQLEAWIKATPQEPLPRGSTEYLYGTLSNWPSGSVTVVHRRTIVLVSSFTALLFGLLLMHVPALRRPQFAAAAAVVLAGSAFLAPQVALLVAQAAALGWMIALAVAAWSWATAGSSQFTAPASSTAPRLRESRSTRPPGRSERSSRVATTAPGQAAIVEVRP